MLRNYILITLRNLRKNFVYSLINILGLGLGLATFLLLTTWILHELSYDTFHQKADRIYRASIEYSYGGQVNRLSVSPTALMPELLNLPETETAVRVYNPSAWNPFVIEKDGTRFQENRFYAADSTFFDVFSFRLLSGDPKHALTQPYSVVLSQSMVAKYFGDEEALGNTLQVNDREYTVTGVMEDVPDNSMMQLDFVCSFNSLRWGQRPPVWGSANFQTFVVLHPGANVDAVREKTNEIVRKATAKASDTGGDYHRYNFTPLTDIYLRSDFNAEPEVVSDIKYIYLFSAIALLILIIACINYVNLSTARAADRAKEVGIRKIVGALRKQLFSQFMGESVIITFLSLSVAFLLALGLLPFFNNLTGKLFSQTVLLQPSFIGLALGILVVIALLSGAYPAFAITSFKPVSVLKGNFKSSGKGIWLRQVLVIFQFSISVMLIAGTLIIVKQLNYMRAKKLGYDRENTIMLPLDAATDKVFDAFRTEALRTEAARYVSRGAESPVSIQGGYVIAPEGQEEFISITGLIADEDYLPSMNMELARGRNFTREDRERISRDTVYAFILNQSALKALYIDEADAIGKRLSMGFRKGEIVGVVKDFHFASLHRNIEPLVIFPEEWQMSKMFIRLPEGDIPTQLKRLEDIYASLITHRPFEYQFLDQQYEALYTHEQQLGTVFIVFASLAIIIACLGLLGLVAFSASQKTKEIGIRKVLGATAPGIVLLITKDFSKLVFIAIVIGLPLAVWGMDQWLSGFAYRTSIGIIPIALSAVICIIIALASAGYQAVKAALIDPAKTLRSE